MNNVNTSAKKSVAPSQYLVTATAKTGYRMRQIFKQKQAAELFAEGMKKAGWTVPSIVHNPKNLQELQQRDQKEELNRICLERNS